MHDTVIKLKSGEKYCGPMDEFRPEFNWISIIDTDTEFGEIRKFCIDDMESAVTCGERVSANEICDQDEIERARRYLADGRKFGWADIPEEKFDWE